MKTFQQSDVFRSMHVMDAVLIPGGRFAVYQLSAVVPGKEKDEDRQASSLWRVDLAGGEPTRLTAKSVDSTAPMKTPDGKAVLFLSARSGKGQIYRLPLDGGEAEALTALEQGVSSYSLSPDGKWLAFAAVEKPAAPADPKAHMRITRLAYRFDPVPGYLQNAPQAVYVMPSDGGEAKAVTAHDGIVSGLAWSPDSKDIAAVIVAKEAQASFAARGDIHVIGRDGGDRVVAKSVVASLPFWTADGKQVGFAGGTGGIDARQPQLWLVDRNGGEPVCRTRALDLAVGGTISTHSPAGAGASHVLVSPDGGFAIVPIARGGELSAWRVALSGPESCEPLVKGRRLVRPLDLAGEKLLVVSQEVNTPCELHLVDLKTGDEKALTHHNKAWQSEFEWPELEHVVVKSGGGKVDIEGWVLKPRHVKPPYKTILSIHGGPHAGFGYGYNETYQELIGAGYAVAFCNPRGSTGYGDAFSSSIIGVWGNPEFEDFNAFLDELVRRGISDPDRLGVTGSSGGGHLSAWMIGHTDRFKAAVPEQGVYNMISVYGTSDAGIELVSLEMGGHPHEQGAIERYWNLSPIAYAHRCKTPTLLIQGEQDVRCPMEQAEQLFTTLKHNGCEVELLRLQNCNHGRHVTGPPPLRRARMDAMKDWFDRHV